MRDELSGAQLFAFKSKAQNNIGRCEMRAQHQIEKQERERRSKMMKRKKFSTHKAVEDDDEKQWEWAVGVKRKKNNIIGKKDCIVHHRKCSQLDVCMRYTKQLRSQCLVKKREESSTCRLFTPETALDRYIFVKYGSNMLSQAFIRLSHCSFSVNSLRSCSHTSARTWTEEKQTNGS